LTAEDVKVLMADILEAIKTPSPADTMFSNEIRMGCFHALTKYHFQEGMAAGVLFAKTQGGHGSETRTGEIMKILVTYGSAARGIVPGLKELIFELNEQTKAGGFPADLNVQRVRAVEDAIRTIEAAKNHPELLSAGLVPPLPPTTPKKTKK
jgi:hypothetical protein